MKTVFMLIELTPKELLQVTANAESCGQTIEEFVREMCAFVPKDDEYFKGFDWNSL